MELSGLKDTDREILSKLDSDTDLLNACSLNKYTWKLCDDNFFRNRLIRKYPDTVKYNKNGKWKEYYLKTIFYISRLLEEYIFVYKTGDPKIYYDILFKMQYRHNQLQKAAENNYLDLVIFLLHNSPQSLRSVSIGNILTGAASNNHIDMIRYFLKEANPATLQQGLLGAIQGGHNDLAIFFVENGVNKFDLAIKMAKLFKNQFMIDYLNKFI